MLFQPEEIVKRVMDPIHRYVVLDVETTGLAPTYGHRVIEIGAVAVTGRTIVQEFSTLVDVGIAIPPEAQKIHGITNEMLTGQPRPEEVMPQFDEFIKGSILVAHNALFDLRFLHKEFERLKLRLSHQYICTLEMSRSRFPRLKNHKLETVYRHIFGERNRCVQRHRALDDARMVAAIWLAMKEK